MSRTLTIFLKNLFFLELQSRQVNLQSTRNCLLLILDAFLVFDRKSLLYSLSQPAPNTNSEEQLSSNLGIFVSVKLQAVRPEQPVLL